MNVLFDSNVILDVFLDREPHEMSAYKLLTLVEKGFITGWLCSDSISVFYFLLANELEVKWVKRHIIELLELFEIVAVDKEILDRSIKSHFSDFEDAVLHHSAEKNNLDCIVTRNKAAFKSSRVQVYTPDELLNILETLR